VSLRVVLSETDPQDSQQRPGVQIGTRARLRVVQAKERSAGLTRGWNYRYCLGFGDAPGTGGGAPVCGIWDCWQGLGPTRR
jgi:hypothetical protein